METIFSSRTNILHLLVFGSSSSGWIALRIIDIDALIRIILTSKCVLVRSESNLESSLACCWSLSKASIWRNKIKTFGTHVVLMPSDRGSGVRFHLFNFSQVITFFNISLSLLLLLLSCVGWLDLAELQGHRLSRNLA